MLAAHLSNTPLPTVWDRYTLGMLMRIVGSADAVMPLINPYAVPEEKPITDGWAARAFAEAHGLRRA
jgi:hypothetical protein